MQGCIQVTDFKGEIPLNILETEALCTEKGAFNTNAK